MGLPGYLEYLLRNIKASPGVPFIIAFMILLILAAIYLAIGLEPVANKLAEYAYYMLVVGVILELIVLIRSRDEGAIQAEE